MPEKKTHPKFKVPEYGFANRKRVKPRWRAQRGIDNKKRMGKGGYGASPNIGYKNSAGVRFARKDGSMEFLVHNERELLSMQKDAKLVAVFAHGLSSRKRVALQKIADSRGIRVINGVRI